MAWGSKETGARTSQHGVSCRVDSRERVRAWTAGLADLGFNASSATQSGGAGGHPISLSFDLCISQRQRRHCPHLKGQLWGKVFKGKFLAQTLPIVSAHFMFPMDGGHQCAKSYNPTLPFSLVIESALCSPWRGGGGAQAGRHSRWVGTQLITRFTLFSH